MTDYKTVGEAYTKALQESLRRTTNEIFAKEYNKYMAPRVVAVNDGWGVMVRNEVVVEGLTLEEANAFVKLMD